MVDYYFAMESGLLKFITLRIYMSFVRRYGVSPLSIAFFLIAVFSVAELSFAREPLTPLRGPQRFVSFGSLAELLDDVYSADLNFAGEYAPCNCFSVYGDFSYRLISYEFDTMLHNQRHEALNLQVNGFNESYLGMKFMPYRFFGVDVNWRLPPGDGSQVNRFHRIGVEPFYLYDFSKGMQLGVAASYYTFLEDDDFQPGDEIGLKASMEWRLAWDYELHRGWLFDYVFLYRWRIQESQNLNMDKPYQDMNDLYRGFRMRVDAGHYFALAGHSLGVALFYEMNRGYLFGMETGHTLGLYTKYVF